MQERNPSWQKMKRQEQTRLALETVIPKGEGTNHQPLPMNIGTKADRISRENRLRNIKAPKL
jgi:hypothetical protein